MNIKSYFLKHDFLLWLVIIDVFFLFVSPPLSNLAEFFMVVSIVSVNQYRQRILEAAKSPVSVSVLVFLLVVFLWLLHPESDFDIGLSEATSWRKALLLPIAMIAVWKRENIELVMRAFVSITFFFLLLSFIGYFGDFVIYHMPVGIVVRNHSTQGLFFVISAYLCLSSWIFGVRTLPNLIIRVGNVLGIKGKTLAVLLAIAFALNVLMITGSRTAFVVMLAVAVYLIAVSNPVGSRLLVWSALAIGSIMVLLMLFPQSRISSMQMINEVLSAESSEYPTSGGLRYLMYTRTPLAIIKSFPWGGGTGGFRNLYASVIPKDATGWQAETVGDPHNQFLKIAADQGLVGITAFLAILVLSWKAMGSDAMGMAGRGVLVAWIVSSLFNSHFSTFSEGHMIFLLLGVFLAPSQMKSRDEHGAVSA